MKIALPLLASACLTVPCLAQPGALDPSFGNAGLVTTILSAATDRISSIALLPDGRIAAAGQTMRTANIDFATLIYRPDGSLATQVFTDFGKTNDLPCKVFVQNDGKIVVAGYTNKNESSIFKFALVRYFDTGQVDSSFGVAGKVTANFNSYLTDKAFAAAMQPDGKFVLAGNAESALGFQFGLARFNSDGSLDTDFGTLGFVITPLQTSSVIKSIALDTDGSILVSGVVHSASAYLLTLARYLPDGNPDLSFGDMGIRITGISVNEQDPQTLLLLPDGKMLWAGASLNQEFFLIRFDHNGLPDSAFGIDGHVIAAFNGSTAARCTAALIQSDGKIIGAGWTEIGGKNRYGLMRFDATGTPDSTFGTDGQVITTVLGNDDAAYCMTFQPDGKLLAAGSSNGAGTGPDFSLARYFSGLVVQTDAPDATLRDLLVYPNPAGRHCTLQYRLMRPEKISLRLWNELGNCVETICVQEAQPAGDREEQILFPEGLPPGIYYLSVEAGAYSRQIAVIHR